jgi:antitoxin component of MazEF toxin-antitoxin module
MSLSGDRFSFTARVFVSQSQGIRLHLISLPEAYVASLTPGRVRLCCEIKGEVLKRATMPDGAGGRGFMIGQTVMKQLGLAEGDEVPVTVWEDSAPEEVDVPEELAEALRQEPAAAACWAAASPGRQRGLAYRVASARQLQTRADRAVAVVRELLAGPPPRRKRKA